MPRHLAILCHGHDPMLLQTRGQIFEQAGLTVQTAASREQFDVILANCEVEVVLLCHSLSEAECEYAKLKAHTTPIPPKVIILNKGTHKCDADAIDQSFDSRSGPAALLLAVSGFVSTKETRLADEQARGPLIRLLEQYHQATSEKR